MGRRGRAQATHLRSPTCFGGHDSDHDVGVGRLLGDQGHPGRPGEDSANDGDGDGDDGARHPAFPSPSTAGRTARRETNHDGDPPFGMGEGGGGRRHRVRWGRVPSHWFLNPAGAQLTAYFNSTDHPNEPIRPGTVPDICSPRWGTAWRWASPTGRGARWVSAAPAFDVEATAQGFLLLPNRIAGCGSRRHARGLSAGDLPWYFVDRRGKLHHLGWEPTPTHRDTDIGAVVCRRDLSYLLPSRYCTSTTPP